MISFCALDLDRAFEIVPERHEDKRGYFCEGFKQAAFREACIAFSPIQENESFSGTTGIVRGIHF